MVKDVEQARSRHLRQMEMRLNLQRRDKMGGSRQQRDG